MLRGARSAKIAALGLPGRRALAEPTAPPIPRTPDPTETHGTGLPPSQRAARGLLCSLRPRALAVISHGALDTSRATIRRFRMVRFWTHQRRLQVRV